MLRSFSEEFGFAERELDALVKNAKLPRKISIATGVASHRMIVELCDRIRKYIPNLQINIYKITNYFFGESITVSGLLTGCDIAMQLRGCDLGEELLLPENTLKANEEVFLCGMTLGELRSELGVPIRISKNDGYEFVSALLGVESED